MSLYYVHVYKNIYYRLHVYVNACITLFDRGWIGSAPE